MWIKNNSNNNDNDNDDNNNKSVSLDQRFSEWIPCNITELQFNRRFNIKTQMLIVYLDFFLTLRGVSDLYKQMPTLKKTYTNSTQASERQRSQKSLIMFAIRCVIVCLLVSRHVFFHRAAGEAH